MNIYEKLSAIQMELKAPKSLHNNFGNYDYRSCEGILESVKPICAKHKTTLILTDEVTNRGDRYYIMATAFLVDNEVAQNSHHDEIVVRAFAREEESKKGMDGSQVTGASSSYARKYALNGLFCIDDAKDSDFTNTGAQDAPQAKKAPTPKVSYPAKPTTPTAQPDAPSCFCNSCGAPISQKVFDFSVKKFDVPLCMDCQKNAR